MKKKLALALCLAAMAVPASARNAEDYWCGTPRIHLMMWIAKVQVWARDDEGKLIRDKDGNLVSGGFGGGDLRAIRHYRPQTFPGSSEVGNGGAQSMDSFDKGQHLFFVARNAPYSLKKTKTNTALGTSGRARTCATPSRRGKFLKS